MTDRTSKILFIFPGQGSQYLGIGKDIYDEFSAARSLYERASAVLDIDMEELSFQDPNDKINLTRYTQPVLLTHSMACLAVFRELTGNRVIPDYVAGHSIGEYSALVAAKALTFETAVSLVAQRGELMGTYGEGEMAAFPLASDAVGACADKHYCAVAACNLPEQTVVGGRGDDLDRVTEELAVAYPRKRAARLKTEGAFHTYYMVKAAQLFREILAGAKLGSPQCRVLSNYTGGFHDDDPALIKARLFLQLFYPVMWHANLLCAMQAGAAVIIEFGGGIGSGDGPNSKRPNLEGIVKKAFRGSSYPPVYFPAINSESLKRTARELQTDR